MKEEADNEIPKTDKHSDSKRKALIAAKIITEANDKVDTPIPALMAELLPLKAFKGVKGFEAKPKTDGSYKIVMYGSEHILDDDYTPKDDKEKQDEKNESNKEGEKKESTDGNGKEKEKGVNSTIDVEPELTFGENMMVKFRKHSQHMREVARSMGIDIPLSPGNIETQISMKNFINKIVMEGEKRIGPYMTLGNVRWYKLKNGITIRKLNGEFISFFDYSKGGVAQQWDKIL
jgi:hypothetical protein